MGLAGKKNKRKLNEDPNNTKWSRNETTFGQKILRSHGWEPGQYLGAKDASHASMHSAASSAPIKITIKDDNMGLGAKIRQKQAGECTGLDVFKDLLGRLNGESDDSISKKQAMRSELKNNLYVERKFGPMRFVRGGLLVGDQITELVKQASESKQTAAKVPSEEAVPVEHEDDGAANSKKEKRESTEKKSKKRKADDAEGNDETPVDKKDSKKKKKKRSREESSVEGSQAQSDSESERKRRKKAKKEKKEKKRSEEDAEDVSQVKSKPKKDKKEKKKRKGAAAASDAPAGVTAIIANASAATSGTSTPIGTGTSTPQPLSRHMVRSRNIASKRMAMSDMTALNQILFVKPV